MIWDIYSSSIGPATLVGFGLLNYRSVFSAGRFLQSAVKPPNLEDQWLERSNSRHQVSLTSETTRANPQQRKVELWARNFREFCRKWRLTRQFWDLSHAVNLRHGTDGFNSLPMEGALRIFFRPKNPTASGRVWTRELGYQRPARSPLDHRSRS